METGTVTGAPASHAKNIGDSAGRHAGGTEQAQNKESVSTSGSRINTGDFTERRSDTDDDQRHAEPTPNDVDGATASKGVKHRGSQTVGNGRENEGHEGDLESRAVALELGLVAQRLEHVVGSAIVGAGGTGSEAVLDIALGKAEVVLTSTRVLGNELRHVDRFVEEP